MPLQQYKKQESQSEFDFSIYNFEGLLNVNAMPQSIPDNALTIAQNFYGSQAGGLYLRKGIAARGTALPTPPFTRVDGLARFEQQIINGVIQNPTVVTTLVQSGGDMYVGAANDASYSMVGGANALGSGALPWDARHKVYDPDHQLPTPAAPTNAAPTGGGSLAAGTYLNSVVWVNAAGQTLCGADLTVSGVTLNQEYVLTRPAAPVGAVSWIPYVSTVNGATGTETAQSAAIPVATATFTVSSISAGAAKPVSNTATAPCDILVICTGVGGPYAWDGTALYVPAAWTANCPAANCSEVVNNILFFGGIPEQPNLIVGMALGHPETLATGAANNFSMTSSVTGLGVIGGGALASLVVGMARGISLINGSGYSNFYQVDLPMQDGCAARRAMIHFDGYCFFLGKDDIYLIDPSGNLTPIGQNVRPYILNDPVFTNPWDVPMNGTRSISWAMYYNKRIYVFYDYTQSGTTNAGLVFDMNLGGWTSFLGPVLNAGCLLSASTDPAPLPCIVGGGTAAQVYNFDVYNGTAQNVDDAGTAINGIVQTKYFKVGQPGTQKKLVRLYPEFFVETINAYVYASTNYGNSTLNSIIAGSPSSSGGIWDTSKWDQSTFGAGGLLTFIGAPTTRCDWDTTFEALAVGVQSNVVQAPFWFQGTTGRAIQMTAV